ncbi:hypothetical protein Angca_001546, partial [Angiostrongylus cantonensis]
EVLQEYYLMVVDHLKGKYGNKQALINQLLYRLHKAQANGKRLEDHEILCETLHSIVCQL